MSEHTKEFSRQSNMINLVSNIENKKTSRYYLLSKKSRNMSHIDEDKRKGQSETEIILAFPIDQNGNPHEEKQEVYAFLPMRSFNFKVRI